MRCRVSFSALLHAAAPVLGCRWGAMHTKSLQTVPEPCWPPVCVTFRQTRTSPQISSALSQLFPSFLSPMILNSPLLRFSGKNQNSSSRRGKKKGSCFSQPFPQLLFSSTIYFMSLPCKQLNVLEPGLSPALLCPAVIAASLRENWFPGMLCMHIPIWALHPHLPTR